MDDHKPHEKIVELTSTVVEPGLGDVTVDEKFVELRVGDVTVHEEIVELAVG